MMDALGGIPRKDVLLNEPLGSGTFGTVYRARLGKQLIAAKEMKVLLAARRNEIIEAARRESKLLMRARHQNVIGLLGVVLDDPNHVYLLMELATGGSLRSFLDSKGVPSLYEQHQLATTIALGMHYLHGLDPPILHHDLKSDNILLVIKEDGTHESKICDFGMATGANLTKMTTQAAGRAGTQMYKAPECFDDVFVAASDVYAFGIVVFELLTAAIPWVGMSDSKVMRQVLNGERPAIPEEAGGSLTTVAKKCWAQDATQRPSFDDLITGSLAHHLVAPELWCITRADLDEFEDQVLEAHRAGQIPMNPLHPDPRHDDPAVGPNMHNVVQHIVKTQTTRVGMSWALMKHRGGLEVDIFATHAWNEGVYEFIRKMKSSWPAGMETLWFCCLANPQTWEPDDLAALLGGPDSDPLKDSPFARALARSKVMVVVPNSSCSIYTRLWCVAEIKVAYDLKKPIRVASERGSTRLLLTDFTSVRDANCSNADDDARIRTAIAGQEDAIDDLIHNLVDQQGLVDLAEFSRRSRVHADASASAPSMIGRSTVIFGAGPLGMTIKERGKVVEVFEVNASGQAREQGVLQGSVVLEVSGQSVVGLEYAGVRELLTNSERPVKVVLQVGASRAFDHMIDSGRV